MASSVVIELAIPGPERRVILYASLEAGGPVNISKTSGMEDATKPPDL